MNEEKIIAVLTKVPNCPLEISLRTGLAYERTSLELERLATEGKIQRVTKWKKPTYRMFSKPARLKDVM